MSFIVEDGTIVANANAYVTVAEFRAYHGDRGNSLAGFSAGNMEDAIVRATDYLDARFQFVGQKRSRSQSTQWPRYNAFDTDNFMVGGVPVEVKEACMEYAFIALSEDINPTPERSPTGQVVSSKSERVDVLSESTTYATGDSFTLPRYPVADLKLARSGLIIVGLQVRRGD